MMKTFVILLAIGCLLAAVYSAEPAGPKTPETASNPGDQPLYLHLLAPRYYTDPPTPARRIVTARIYLSYDFAVIVDGDPNTTLSGRIDKEGGKYVAHDLSGMSNGTKNLFEGEMELDKPAHSTSGIFSGGMWSAVFVLSTNSDSTPLLKKIDPEAFKANTKAK